MTREEAIRKLAEADGPDGKLMGSGDWGRALVLSLELLGLIKFDDEGKDDAGI